MKDRMLFQTHKVTAVLFCLFVYFPILCGNGECVSICISQKGSGSIIYLFPCAKHHPPVSNMFSVLHRDDNHPCIDIHIDLCRDGVELTSKSSWLKVISHALIDSVSTVQITHTHVIDNNHCQNDLRLLIPSVPLSSVLII
jgi:hypothetical protein